jgi:hypothetical protein
MGQHNCYEITAAGCELAKRGIELSTAETTEQRVERLYQEATIAKPKLIKWWRVGYTGIESSEFVSETADYLIRGDGRKVKKVGGYERWFATREEAVKSRLKELEQSVKSAAARLRDAERELAKFRKTEGV